MQEVVFHHGISSCRSSPSLWHRHQGASFTSLIPVHVGAFRELQTTGCGGEKKAKAEWGQIDLFPRHATPILVLTGTTDAWGEVQNADDNLNCFYHQRSTHVDEWAAVIGPLRPCRLGKAQTSVQERRTLVASVIWANQRGGE